MPTVGIIIPVAKIGWIRTPHLQAIEMRDIRHCLGEYPFLGRNKRPRPFGICHIAIQRIYIITKYAARASLPAQATASIAHKEREMKVFILELLNNLEVTKKPG